MPWRFLFAAAALTGAALADWPQFRGPQMRGVAEEKGLPDTWSTTENVAWAKPVPGLGWSSPIVAGNRIYLTSVVATAPIEPIKKGLYFGGERPAPSDEHRWVVYAIDFDTGKIAWEREVHRGAPPQSRHLKNTYASETPVTDGERIYAYFGNVGLYALDRAGRILWTVPFPARKTRYGWGTAASPVLDGERLYVVVDNDEESYLLSLDKRTGKTVWKVPRQEKSNWATPYVWKNGQRTEIITPGTGRVRSYDPDGKLLWELGGMSSIVIPTPFSAHGLLYLSSGYVGDQNRPALAMKPGAKGEILLKAGETPDDIVAWYHPQAGPYNPTPIVYGDIYYTLFDRGFLTAHDARTGREIYGKQRIDPETTAFTASPWAYNDRIFMLSEDGDTFVVQAGPEFRVLGKNRLDELSMATPAIHRGSIVIRTLSKLYRISAQRPRR
ncbi:MAG: PQQ-binding-like beta-propeller repeat protein [Bryobacteraceae bacterium]